MSYTTTFIQVAEDCPVSHSIIPEAKGPKAPKHLIEYELLTDNPYTYTHDDLVFEVFVRQKNISQEELHENGEQMRAEFLAKGQPCLRASSLTKKYGWGAHYNEEGKIALYGMETEEYKKFVQTEGIKLYKGMRSSRK